MPISLLFPDAITENVSMHRDASLLYFHFMRKHETFIQEQYHGLCVKEDFEDFYKS